MAHKNWECTSASTHPPNSELTAMLLIGTVSDPAAGIMQHMVGWNPGDFLYTPVLQVRVGHDTVKGTEVALCTNPSPLSSVGLETSESGDKSWSNRRLTSSCWKKNNEKWLKLQSYMHVIEHAQCKKCILAANFLKLSRFKWIKVKAFLRQSKLLR